MQETEDYEQTRNTTRARRRRGLVGARCGVAQQNASIAILGSGPHQAGGPLAHAAIREAELRDAAVDAQRSLVPLSWTVDRGLAAATRLMDLSKDAKIHR